MCTPDGYLYSREAILESLLQQKKANRRKLAAWEAQQQDELRKVPFHCLVAGKLLGVPGCPWQAVVHITEGPQLDRSLSGLDFSWACPLALQVLPLHRSSCSRQYVVVLRRGKNGRRWRSRPAC